MDLYPGMAKDAFVALVVFGGLVVVFSAILLLMGRD
jgi:hypothetical protein